MKLFKFTQYINESEEKSIEISSEVQKLIDTSKKLDYLLSVGLIDQSGYAKEVRDITRGLGKFVRGLKLDAREEADLAILKQIGEVTGLAALQALSSPGATALASKGLHLVSSPTQLVNGTLVWSLDPNYRRSDGWGIGFFPDTKSIKRMTPKGINLGVRWGAPGSMDIVIKKWPWKNPMSTPEFYNEAMLWAADNIDFEDVKSKPNPKAWKYYTKRTTGQKDNY
jgi:hypothetical protein